MLDCHYGSGQMPSIWVLGPLGRFVNKPFSPGRFASSSSGNVNFVCWRESCSCMESLARQEASRNSLAACLPCLPPPFGLRHVAGEQGNYAQMKGCCMLVSYRRLRLLITTWAQKR